jgi:hypothetical protein
LIRLFILFKFNIKEYRFEFPEEELLSYQSGQEKEAASKACFSLLTPKSPKGDLLIFRIPENPL